MDPAAPVQFGHGEDAAAVGLRPLQGFTLLGVVGAVLVVMAVGVFRGDASSSAHPDVVGGSVVVSQTGHHPVVVDVARGKATSRLVGLGKAVGADGDPDSVGYAPTSVGTFLFHQRTGNYNLLGKDNLVVLRSGGGIALPAPADPGAPASIAGVATDDGLFLIRRNASGAARTQAWLVDRDTVRSGATGETVVPRAAADLPEETVDDPAAAVVHDGALWLVAGGAEPHLVRLRLDSDPKDRTMHVERGAAVAAGAVVAAGGGVVAAAAPGATEALVVPARSDAAGNAGAPAPAMRVVLPGLATATAVVPVRGAEGAWFALRSPQGWSLAGIGDDGRVAGAVDVPDSTAVPMVAIPQAIDRHVVLAGTDGSIIRVDLQRGTAGRVPGASSYPVDPAEAPDATFFRDILVVAQSRWFVVNAPQSLHSIVIPADDAPASIVDKSGAQDVDPAAPPSPSVQAQAKDAADPNNPNAPTTLPGAPPEASVRDARTPEQITDAHECENVNQKPRKPQIVALEPTKDSMTVRWTYVKLDPGDCQPSSYLIEAHATDGAPDPSPAVQAHTNAETQFLFTGLRPNHTYELTVTAVIGTNRTTSDPMKRRTDSAGPDAPLDVSTSADAPGGWNVTWGACEGTSCDVPVAAWQVSWALCGAGYLGEQAPVSNLPASSRSLAVTLAAHPDLVGRSLTFTVTAVSEQGQRASTSDGSCTEGWREPDAGRVVVDIGARIVDGSTVEATVSIATTPDKAATFGSSSPLFTYHVDDRTVGPTAELQGVVRGLAPGVERTVTVTITSHGVSRSTEPKTMPAAFLDWPPISASATVVPSSTNLDVGTVTFTVAQVPPDPLSGHAELNCAGLRVAHDGPLEAGVLRWDVDLVNGIGPDCDALITVRQTAATPRYSPTAVPAISAGTLHLAPLAPPAITSRWATEVRTVDGVPQEVVVVHVEGALPPAGDLWNLVATGPCDVPRIDLLPGQVLNVTLSESCVGADGKFAIFWRYLATTSGQEYAVPGDRPVITTTTTAPPTTTTTVPPTTEPPSTTTTVPRLSLRRDGAAPSPLLSSPAPSAPDGRMPPVDGGGPAPRAPLLVLPTVVVLAVVRRRRQEHAR